MLSEAGGGRLYVATSVTQWAGRRPRLGWPSGRSAADRLLVLCAPPVGVRFGAQQPGYGEAVPDVPEPVRRRRSAARIDPVAVPGSCVRFARRILRYCLALYPVLQLEQLYPRLVITGVHELLMSGMYQGCAGREAPCTTAGLRRGGLAVLRCSRTRGGFQPYLAVAAASILPPAAEPDPPAMEGAVQAPGFDSILRSRHDPVTFARGQAPRPQHPALKRPTRGTGETTPRPASQPGSAGGSCSAVCSTA